MECCSSSSSLVRCGKTFSFPRCSPRSVAVGWRIGARATTHFCIRAPRQIAPPPLRASLTANVSNETTIASARRNDDAVRDPLILALYNSNSNSNSPPLPLPLPEAQSQSQTEAENLDHWVQNSVTEIVRNIEEAPFLMHVYSTSNSNTARFRVVREKAVADTWPSITSKWKQGSPIPDGIILVEQLTDNDHDHPHLLQRSSSTTTKVWGLLIQGRGVDRAACYILKTCRVLSSMGFCTHFCLVKAKCFGDSTKLQLNNSWTIPTYT